MEERDDWKLGDDGEPVACPRCGKPNRGGLSYCTICGSPLAGEDLAADPETFRTLGEAMGGRRPRQARRARSLRAWTIAAATLLVTVVVLTWLQTREQPFRLEDWTAPAAIPTPVATLPPAPPTMVATRVVRPTAVPVPTGTATAAAPEPTAVATPVPTPRRTAVKGRRAVAPPAPTRRAPARAEPPPVREDPGDARPRLQSDTAPEDLRPRVEATEKPSLGSDLQEATRVYRQAVEVHNARVDEYNALVDEIQRRNAWDDSEGSVELRRRLDRARAAVESARVQAEMLRARMESVRAKYR
ncbi:MAG: hypothetical protein IT293_07330 [Deltaproteobacteria bacterium]|nr:hypothetical protein [Deltaproteobacteria bacterium]